MTLILVLTGNFISTQKTAVRHEDVWLFSAGSKGLEWVVWGSSHSAMWSFILIKNA